MDTVLLIVQVLIAVGLVVVILLQRSEGGALGVGGGPGGMMSGRGAANVMTRTTMVLAGLFIANSIGLAVYTGVNANGDSVFDRSLLDQAPIVLEETEDDTGGVPTDG
jgi:preprotein translocase subunit SecG